MRRSVFGPQHTDFAPQCQHFREPYHLLADGTLMAANDPLSPFWSPSRHRDRRPFLMARAKITKALRCWFEVEGFCEVEPSILQVSPGNEPHLHAPRTALMGPDGTRAVRYLRTSPE